MSNKSEALVEGEDFIMNDQGLLVFTAKYLLKRGHCCQSGCENCPYGFTSAVDPNYPAELQSPWDDQDS
jgi:hypothetical protein